MTHYFHSGSNEIAEYTGTALKARYIYGPGTDEVLAQIDYSDSAGSEAETSRRFFYSDGLGSVIATLDETGAVTKKYRYSPFGIHADTNDHSDQPWGYTGQRYDADSGLYYYKARYYHPSLGRFLSVDPVGYDDQMNLYAYVANRPMMFRDPSGRCLTSATNTASDAWDITKEAIYDIPSHLSDHLRVGYIVTFDISEVFGATIDLGSVRLADQTGVSWTAQGNIGGFSEGRTYAELEVAHLGSVSSTSTTYNNGDSWNYGGLDFDASNSVEILDGLINGDPVTIEFSFGIIVVYEGSFTIGGN